MADQPKLRISIECLKMLAGYEPAHLMRLLEDPVVWVRAENARCLRSWQGHVLFLQPGMDCPSLKLSTEPVSCDFRPVFCAEDVVAGRWQSSE